MMDHLVHLACLIAMEVHGIYKYLIYNFTIFVNNYNILYILIIRLTAFVAKAFKQAAAYIPIEDRIINEALQWLSNNQAPNGSFPEVGRVSHRDMQGGAAKGLTLTAFTLIAFLENGVSIIYLIL